MTMSRLEHFYVNQSGRRCLEMRLLISDPGDIKPIVLTLKDIINYCGYVVSKDIA